LQSDFQNAMNSHRIAFPRHTRAVRITLKGLPDAAWFIPGAANRAIAAINEFRQITDKRAGRAIWSPKYPRSSGGGD